MAVIQEYFRLTKEYIEKFGEKTVLWYQVGSFYEMYATRENDGRFSGCNIQEFAKIGNLAMGRKTATIVMLGFSTYMIDKYIPNFQAAGYTIVVYDQDANTKNTTRSLKGIISPGTYFSQDCNQVDNNIMTIWFEPLKSKFSQNSSTKLVIGIANINILTGSVNILEFSEEFLPNMHTTYNDIERTLSIYKPNELIVISNESMDEITKMLPFFNFSPLKEHILSLTTNDVHTQTKLKNCEKQIYQHEVLSKFFKPDDSSFFSEYNARPFATQALTYLLNFIEMHNPNLIKRLNKPTIDLLTSRLILENHSLRQLNIINDGSNNGPYSSVLKFLNKCITPMGKRKLENILLNPTTDIEYLSREYAITDFILNNIDALKVLTARLTDVKDIEKLMRQLVLRKITPSSITNIHSNLNTLKEIYGDIQKYDTFILYLSNFTDLNIIESADIINRLIDNTIDINIAQGIDTLSGEVNFIRTGVDNELDHLTTELKINNERICAIRKYLHDQILSFEKKSTSSDYVKLHETEKKGLTICATKKRCETLKACLATKTKSVSSVTLITEADSSFAFDISNITFRNLISKTENSIVSPQITEGLDKIWSLRQQIKDRVTMLYLRFLSDLQEISPILNELVVYITMIDLAYTRGTIAHKYNYCRPKIVKADNSFLDITGIRHCLIEHISQEELYVTNDVSLGVDGLRCNGILLYGTNAVGKTSLIRAIGISVIMAQAGFYVPCGSMTFSPYNHIFTRILSNDNLFQGHSTFTVEICELRRIIENANNKSLILGDEICSGTEINSAISIFVAALERLHENNCSFIFATHLHMVSNYNEIIDLANLQKKHMTVVYDAKNSRLIYDRKLREGSGNDMYGLEVCKSMLLPQEFMERCYSIREKYNMDSILNSNQSRYNSNKIKYMCQICNKNGAEHIHHLCYQNEAGENGYIDSFHKDHAANLVSICEPCHHNIHANKLRYRFIKTSTGMELQQLE